MKFRFLLIGLFVVFSSVGSYADDYLRFNLKSIKLLENTWGKGNAKLKLFLITDNLDEGQSQLDISHKEFLSLGTHEELKLSGKAGLSVPVRNGHAVNIYILAINEDENSVLARLAIASIGKVSGSQAVKFYKGFGKTGFFKSLSKFIPITKLKSLIDFGVSEATEISVEKLMQYLEDNKIGTTKLHIDPMTMPSNKYVKDDKTSGEGTFKISYDMEFIEENKDSINSSSSSTQTTKNSKWIVPSYKVCKQNGGTINKGTCRAKLSDAKIICDFYGGRLVNINELKKVMVDCGGKIGEEGSTNNAIVNLENQSYISCCKAQGFSGRYLTSTKPKDSNYDVLVVSFEMGGYGGIDMDDRSYVRCIEK